MRITPRSMKFVRHVSEFTDLFIGTDWKNDRYYVVNSTTGKKWNLGAGIICWTTGAILTTLAIILGLGSCGGLEWAEEWDAITVLTWSTLFGVSIVIGKLGWKLLTTYKARPDWQQWQL